MTPCRNIEEGMNMESIKTILHPTDFSRHSEYALALACGLARDHGAQLIILHVVPSTAPITGGWEVSDFSRAECYQQDLRSYREEMKARLELLPLPGLPVRAKRVLKEGITADEILSAAQETACDLIVMGTHGWTGEARRLMGSVAEEVAQKASCSVVTVKAPRTVPQAAVEPVMEEVGVIL
jgi:nucleotide-binding universal stress UspA family protein